MLYCTVLSCAEPMGRVFAPFNQKMGMFLDRTVGFSAQW